MQHDNDEFGSTENVCVSLEGNERATVFSLWLSIMFPGAENLTAATAFAGITFNH